MATKIRVELTTRCNTQGATRNLCFFGTMEQLTVCCLCGQSSLNHCNMTIERNFYAGDPVKDNPLIFLMAKHNRALKPCFECKWEFPLDELTLCREKGGGSLVRLCQICINKDAEAVLSEVV